jgi:hypothetical protein
MYRLSDERNKKLYVPIEVYRYFVHRCAGLAGDQEREGGRERGERGREREREKKRERGREGEREGEFDGKNVCV